MRQHSVLKRHPIPVRPAAITLSILESRVQVRPRDHRFRVFDQHFVEEDGEGLASSHHLVLPAAHQRGCGQDMLAGSEIRVRALNGPREDCGQSFRGFQRTQEGRVRGPLLLVARIGVLHVLVLEGKDSQAARHRVRTLIHSESVVRAHHERVRSGEGEFGLEFKFALHVWCRGDLLERVAVDYPVRRFLDDAQSDAHQEGACSQEVLVVVGHQESLGADVRVSAESAGDARHDDALTVGAAAGQDRHCCAVVFGLVPR